jgi:hypothetical protein
MAKLSDCNDANCAIPFKPLRTLQLRFNVLLRSMRISPRGIQQRRGTPAALARFAPAAEHAHVVHFSHQLSCQIYCVRSRLQADLQRAKMSQEPGKRRFHYGGSGRLQLQALALALAQGERTCRASDMLQPADESTDEASGVPVRL